MLIQKIHRQASKLYFVLPLIALITFLGFESKANPVQLNYSSDEIFKGLFFAAGPVASQIPELEGVHISNFISDDKQLQSALQYQEKIFNEVKQSNPQAVEGLSNAINTGNLVKIEKAVETASNAMLEAVSALNSADQKSAIEQELETMETTISKSVGEDANMDELNTAASEYLSNMFASSSYSDRQALLLYLVVVFAIAVYAAAYFWTQGPRSAISVDNNEMYKERIILSVSKLGKG